MPPGNPIPVPLSIHSCAVLEITPFSPLYHSFFKVFFFFFNIHLFGCVRARLPLSGPSLPRAAFFAAVHSLSVAQSSVAAARGLSSSVVCGSQLRPGIEPESPALQARLSPTRSPGTSPQCILITVSLGPSSGYCLLYNKSSQT